MPRIKSRGRRRAPSSPKVNDNGNPPAGEHFPVQNQPPAPQADPDEEHPNDAEVKAAKRQKKCYRLKDEREEEHVLEWVRENPCLWDMKSKDYKNKSKKERLWQDKAEELRYDVNALKAWYVDLRDRNTKLHAQRSGDGQKLYTARENWIMDKFGFLRSTIRHRRAPVKSVREALALAEGDLDEAERIAAEDKLAIPAVDKDDDQEDREKSKKQEEDRMFDDMKKKFAETQAEISVVKQALAEPVTERSCFLDWVVQVCKGATDEQYTEFQTTFISLHGNWKRQRSKKAPPMSSFQPPMSAPFRAPANSNNNYQHQPWPSSYQPPFTTSASGASSSGPTLYNLDQVDMDMSSQDMSPQDDINI